MPSAATSTPWPSPGSRGQRNGKTLETDAVHVMHLKDGKATESWVMSKDQAATDAFWS